MVGMLVVGGGRRRAVAVAIGLAVSSVAWGCILDNPKFDEDATLSGGTSGSGSGSVSDSVSSSSIGGSGTETLSGSGSATGSSGATVTAGSLSDGTLATSDVSATDSMTDSMTGPTTDSTSDSGSTSGGEKCSEDEKIDVFLDMDMDSFGGEAIKVCPAYVPKDAVVVGGDCDDLKPEVNPDAIELCDGFDNNCNGLKDEHSPENSSCDLFDGPFYKTCYLSEHQGHFYYACERLRISDDANGECKKFAVSDGAKSYHWKIDGMEEHQTVGALAANLQGNPSIGLFDPGFLNLKKDHEWIVDGAGLSFGDNFGDYPWAGGQPSNALERWTEMDRNTLLWNDIGDLELRPFICEAEPAS